MAIFQYLGDGQVVTEIIEEIEQLKLGSLVLIHSFLFEVFILQACTILLHHQKIQVLV